MRDDILRDGFLPDEIPVCLDRLPYALRVADLIRPPGVLEYWRQRCHESFQERQERREKLDAWKQQRAAHMLRQHNEQAVLNWVNEGNPCHLQDFEQTEGWKMEAELAGANSQVVNSPLVWVPVPPELASDKEPYADGPLPFLSQQHLSLADCYLVLALVHDDKRRDACRINRFGPEEEATLMFPSDEWYEWSYWRNQSERVSGLRTEHQMTLDDCLARVEVDLREALLRNGEAPETDAKGHPTIAGEDEKPRQYLKNWREILDCLELSNNEENQRYVAKMNRQYEGPIKAPSRGGQPMVEKTKLVDWWNHLEIQWANEGNSRNAAANVEARYKHGKGETVVPEIGGHVKKRRGSGK